MRDKPKGTRIWGYARVSTDDQDLALQKAALEKFGVDGIFEEKASGAKMDRKVFRMMLNRLYLRRGDTLVVWKLDRLGRNLMGVLEVIEDLTERGVKLVSITDGFDARTPMGRAMMQIALVFAELERNLISERTKAGMAAAKKEGRLPGRRQLILSYPKRVKRLRELDKSGKLRNADGELIMARDAVVEALNKADPKAPKIKSEMTIKRWQDNGFSGLQEDQD